MSYGNVPPSRLPGQTPPQGAGVGVRLSKALKEAIHGPGNRAAYVQAATMRLRSIGSEEANKYADILEANPEGATAWVDQYGGWQALEDGLRSAASSGTARAYAESLEKGTPEYYEALYQSQQREPKLGDSLRVATEKAEGAATRGFQGSEGALDRTATAENADAQRQFLGEQYGANRDVTRDEGELDRASAEIIAGLRAAATGSGGRAAHTKAVEIDSARDRFRRIAARHKWSAKDIRRIAGKADSMNLQVALRAVTGGDVGADDENFAAALYKVGNKYKGHGFGDEQSFADFAALAMEDMSPAADAARTADEDEKAVGGFWAKRLGPGRGRP